MSTGYPNHPRYLYPRVISRRGWCHNKGRVEEVKDVLVDSLGPPGEFCPLVKEEGETVRLRPPLPQPIRKVSLRTPSFSHGVWTGRARGTEVREGYPASTRVGSPVCETTSVLLRLQTPPLPPSTSLPPQSSPTLIRYPVVHPLVSRSGVGLMGPFGEDWGGDIAS